MALLLMYCMKCFNYSSRFVTISGGEILRVFGLHETLIYSHSIKILPHRDTYIHVKTVRYFSNKYTVSHFVLQPPHMMALVLPCLLGLHKTYAAVIFFYLKVLINSATKFLAQDDDCIEQHTFSIFLHMGQDFLVHLISCENKRCMLYKEQTRHGQGIKRNEMKGACYTRNKPGMAKE